MIEHAIIPNGQGVDFDPSSHTYTVNGKEVPSITQLLTKVYGDTYASVNPIILQKASEYGTAVHEELSKIIEMRKLSPDLEVISAYPEVNNYFKFIEPIYHLEPVMTEQIVVLYDPDGDPVAAGRFDLLCKVNGELTLADFKTTSTIHKQLVSAQLNLYLLAAYQSGYLKDTNLQLGVIHLNKDKCKYVPLVKFNDGFYLQFIQ